MKTFKIEATGILPMYVSTLVQVYTNKAVTKEAITQLDSDIAFCVCDLKEAHGNLNKHSKDAWLSPRNSDGSFNVRITFN